MIGVRNLVKTIRNGANEVQIIRDISFDVAPREFVAIMGPSGSGKSTLLGLIAGLDAPTSGSIVIDGQEITRLREDELAQLRGKKLGFVFQSYHLIPTLTAVENVLLPMDFNGITNGASKRADYLMDSVGLTARRNHYPAQLSGGEQQRVALARAFMMKPAVLLADEPTGNLDTQNGQHVLELLVRLNKQEGTTLVLVTHDEMLASHAGRRIMLRDGRIHV
ncbi:MAG TPA: ABC transporter ATP-binding protein [Terriglobia bacterium]|jgi:putative ABC transport system ATP-binding protein